MTAVAVTYRVDGDGLIAAVGGAWDEFALAGGAPELAGAAVVGTPLAAHVADEETAWLLESVLTAVRASQRPVRLPFRCDSPELRRFMEMTLAPTAGGAVDVTCSVRRLEPRPAAPLLDPRARRSREFLRVCGWCRDVFVDGHGWQPVESAVRRLRLFEHRVPALTHGTCGPCRDRLLAAAADSD